MKKHNQYLKKEQIAPVSRKTNEEIDEDEAGNLIIGGKNAGIDQSISKDKTGHEMLQKDSESLDHQED